jgi:O-antigen/teichoic acid export membrane protein
MSSNSLTAPEAVLLPEEELTVPSPGPATTGRRGAGAERAEHEAALKADVAHSMRNAVKLAFSLVGTWAVALAVRIFLPRYLGPESFGAYQFADAFTTVAFVITTLGVDMYVRKEVATRHEHASDFFGGTTAVRLLLSALVLVVSLVALSFSGKSSEVVRLVSLLGLAQILFNLNGTTAALLHAAGRVDGLSVLNIGTKMAWGGGVALAVAMGGGVQAAGAAMLASEAIRAVGLYALARRAIGLRWRIDVTATRTALLQSFPFWVGAIAQTVYARLDTSIMSFLTSDVEVGWYGATQTLVGLSLMLTPLIGWVLLPLTARVAARSREDLLNVGRRALALILTIAFPTTLLLSLNADLAVQALFGTAYAPAAASLRIVAPIFVLTYCAMVAGTLLIRLDRSWLVTAVILGGMALSALLNLALVPWGARAFGPGGAGIGAGITLITAEVATTIAMFCLIGRGAVDRPLGVLIGKTLGVCAAVAAAHLAMGAAFVPANAPAGLMAFARLGADVVLYAGLCVTVGAIDVRNLRSFLGQASALRRGGEAAG